MIIGGHPTCHMLDPKFSLGIKGASSPTAQIEFPISVPLSHGSKLGSGRLTDSTFKMVFFLKGRDETIVPPVCYDVCSKLEFQLTFLLSVMVRHILVLIKCFTSRQCLSRGPKDWQKATAVRGRINLSKVNFQLQSVHRREHSVGRSY